MSRRSTKLDFFCFRVVTQKGRGGRMRPKTWSLSSGQKFGGLGSYGYIPTRKDHRYERTREVDELNFLPPTRRQEKLSFRLPSH